MKSVSTNGEGRRCRYTDGDEEDLHLDDIKKCNKSYPRTYNLSRRSTRKNQPSAKASINVMIEEMRYIQATLLRLKVQKE